MDIKIGLLLPKSDMFPALSLDFLNGLKLAFIQLSDSIIHPKFCIEGIGNAADDIILRIAEKMILQEEVDLVISFCSFSKLNELNAIFNGYKKPLIHVDLGAQVLKKENRSPYVLHHTLNLWQSAYASGIYAAKTYGKKAAITASFYDGGYQLIDSFVRGFTENGGEIVYNYVGPMDYKTETFETMIQGIQNSKPDVIFSLFSYKEANKIFDLMANSEINGSIPIMSFPLMTDEENNDTNHNIEDVYSIASWAFDDDSSEMKNFISKYNSSYSKDPNIFSLLGFEVGKTISDCIQNEANIPSNIGEYMNLKIINTPRGEISYNSYNESQVSNFKLRKFNFNKTKYHNTVLERIDATFSEELYQKYEDIPLTGWKNPYICT